MRYVNDQGEGVGLKTGSFLFANKTITIMTELNIFLEVCLMIFKNEETRQKAVNLARSLFDEGRSTSEVAAIMCLSESTVRSLKGTIDKTKNNCDVKRTEL